MPLRQRIQPHHIHPILNCCFKKKKDDFKHNLKFAILQELNLKMPKSESDLLEDPFLILGFGVNSYFDFLLALSRMFLVITVFSLPLMIIYSRGNETVGAFSD